MQKKISKDSICCACQDNDICNGAGVRKECGAYKPVTKTVFCGISQSLTDYEKYCLKCIFFGKKECQPIKIKNI
jgi:hypothetical protein